MTALSPFEVSATATWSGVWPGAGSCAQAIARIGLLHMGIEQTKAKI